MFITHKKCFEKRCTLHSSIMVTFPGLYCKWLIRGQPGHQLRLQVLDAEVKPLQEDCGYDGVVIYDGPSENSPTHGECSVSYQSGALSVIRMFTGSEH